MFKNKQRNKIKNKKKLMYILTFLVGGARERGRVSKVILIIPGWHGLSILTMQ